jgi:hypothetical protein
MEVNHILEGRRPKSQVDDGWLLLPHMEELLPCALTEATDGLLCNAVLEVSVDPTKGKTLSLGAATGFESIFCKLSVIAVVVEDADAMLLGKFLERALGFHGLF